METIKAFLERWNLLGFAIAAIEYFLQRRTILTK